MNTYPPMRIAISPTAIKVTAAKNAARRASADLGVDVSVVESKHKFGSGVPEQPGTLVEGHLGALNRAKPLLDAPDATDATHALGVENTAAYMGGGKWTDPAVVVLLGRDGEETCTTSVGFPMPNKQLGQAISDEHKHTAGSDIAKDLGCDGANWQKTMSDGLTPRDKLIEDAVYTAIVLAAVQAKVA